MDELNAFLLDVARAAGVEIMKVYATSFDVHFKGPSDPVTEADKRANGLICERIEKAFPGSVIVAEESPESEWAHFRGHERVFFVDPLDGTREFVAKNGQFVVMIGLLEGSEPTHGVVHSPVQERAWVGSTGRGTADPSRPGAFEVDAASSRELRIAGPADLGRACIVSSRSHRTSLLERALAALGGREVLPIGSAGLKGAALVSGKADVYLAPEMAGARWDSCAPEAIVRAAGGVYTDAHGQRLDYRAARLENDRGIVAASPALHADVIARLKPLFDPAAR